MIISFSIIIAIISIDLLSSTSLLYICRKENKRNVRRMKGANQEKNGVKTPVSVLMNDMKTKQINNNSNNNNNNDTIHRCK